MPLYEYECENCKRKFELLVSVNSKIQYCPVCGHKLKKLISLCNFQLKGNGWYATDYKNTKVNDEKENVDGANTCLSDIEI